MMCKRAWLYSSRAGKEDRITVLRSKELVEYAKEQDYLIVGKTNEICHKENGFRDGLDDIVVPAAEAGQMDVVLVKSVSVISSDLETLYELVEYLECLNVEVIALDSGLLDAFAINKMCEAVEKSEEFYEYIQGE